MKQKKKIFRKTFAAKFLIVIIIVLFNPFVFSHLYSQTVLWAGIGTSPGFEDGNAIVTDDSGNVYVTGQFEFTTYFGTTHLYASGSHDIFVAKYNASGSLIWIRKAGGRDGDIGLGIGIDAMHNVYITGEIEDTVQFSPTITVSSSGGNDIFLAKYDVNGNVDWVNVYGNAAGSDKGRALAVSPAGNCYFTGNFTINTTFGTKTLSTNGGNDIFVVKVNTDGDVEWAKKAGGTYQDRGYGIALDGDENVFVTGTFVQSATFKNTTVTNNGQSSAFVAKYDSTGSFEWVRTAGDCCDSTKSNAIALDNSGNIYIAGYFNDETEFDNYNFVSSGLGDIVIAKYNPSGDVVWAKRAGGVGDDAANGIAFDNKNQTVYITGMISATSQFDNLTIPIAGYRDIFIAAYDSSGIQKWVKTYGGSHRDIGLAIAVDDSGYIYSTGLFNGAASFDTILLNGYPNQNWSDIYVIKSSPAMSMLPSTNVTGLNVTPANCHDLTVSFIPGNGNGRIIIAREASQVSAIPMDGFQYNVDSIFGNGSDLGHGNFIVYDGSGSQVTVTGLTVGVQYHFTAIEYNGYGAARTYNTIAPQQMSAQPSTYSINLSGLQSAICEGDSLTLIASGATSYSWFPSTGLTSITYAMVNVSPAASTSYSVAGMTANGCYAQTNFTLTVNPLPVISLSPFSPVCESSQPLALNFATPAGGTYTGNGVSGNMFNPAIGPGSYIINYMYSDINGCSSSANMTGVVNASPIVSIGNDTTICSGDLIVLNAGAGYSSYVWSTGSMTSSTVADSSGTGIGIKSIYVEVSNSSGCTSRDTINVMFDICAGIVDQNFSNVNIYPNPFNKALTVSSKEKVSITVYDLNGRIVDEKMNSNGEFVFGENLSAGTYYLQLSNNGSRKTYKVIKIN